MGRPAMTGSRFKSEVRLHAIISGSVVTWLVCLVLAVCGHRWAIPVVAAPFVAAAGLHVLMLIGAAVEEVEHLRALRDADT